MIPDIVPVANQKFRNRSPGWMDAATIIPWEVYVRTGDAGVLAGNFPMMEKLVAWYRSHSVDGLTPGIKGYGDWLQPYAKDRKGATMWERWNSYTRDKGFGDATMNSFNHYAYGAVGQWMYERVAGLAPDPANPGYKHFFVRPLVGERLTSARAELETPYGRASSAWVKRDGKVLMDVVVPPNTTATIEFPGERKPETVAAGTYHFEVSLK